VVAVEEREAPVPPVTQDALLDLRLRAARAALGVPAAGAEVEEAPADSL